MVRYYFNLKDGVDLADSSGIELPHDQAAIAHAGRIVVAIVESMPTHSGPQRYVAVVEENGREVADVPVHPVKAPV